jgi:hypothetical protein
MDSPQTLQQAILYYADPKNCIAEMVAQRWPDGKVICPTCGRNDVTWQEKAQLWQCKSKHSKRKFTAKTGTIYEDSPLGLDKWLMATWMVVNCKNGVSSYEIARSLGVTQKSAWFMLHRIRLAMKDTRSTKLGGKDGAPVEVDESFVGGNPKNWHNSHREKMNKEVRNDRVQRYKNAYTHKTAVMGMFDRDSREVRAKVIPNVRRETLQAEILKNIHYGSKVFTDEAVTYKSLNWEYIHKTVNHAETYVNGQVHTNSLENFWSLMKRNLRGTYVAVEPFHLDRYIDEQVFRFNNRQNKTDADRFRKVLSQIVGKRLTYEEVTGKVGETAF